MTHRDTHTMNSSRNLLTLAGSASALACVLTLSACTGAGTVQGDVDVIDKRSETLLSGDLESVDGTYGAGCTNRTGAWSLGIGIGAVLDNDELSVILNNDACVLTLTELHTSTGEFVASPSFALTASYKANASAFDDPISFYANAKLDSTAFDGDFLVTILYADDPALADGSNTATFEVVSSSSMGDSVTVPNYTLDTAGLHMVADADQVVQSVTGSVALTAGMQVGQTYVVVDDSGLTAYADLDAAYTAGTPAAVAATVPAADFTLVTEDLDNLPIRTLIIANIENDVASYQAFEITFHPAVIVP